MSLVRANSRLMFQLFWPLLIVWFVLPSRAAGDTEALLNELNRESPVNREKRLIEGAKKEGSVVIYSSENATLLQGYEVAFAKRYPFIKAEFWRANGDRVGARVLTEFRARKLQADLVGLAFDVVNEIKAAGILMRYQSPERKAYAEAFKDSDGYFTPTNLIHVVIGYNTKLVNPREAPKDYPDLLNPSWKGSVAIDAEPSRALMGWLKVWGEDKTRKYLEGLVRNGITVTRGHTLQAQLICAGEYKLGVELYFYTAAQLQRTGCPLGIVYPHPTSVAPAQSWAIPATAPHPHAAVLWYDYELSEEAQRVLAKRDFVPTNRKVDTPLNKVPLLVVDPKVILDQQAKWTKLYEELFTRAR